LFAGKGGEVVAVNKIRVWQHDSNTIELFGEVAIACKPISVLVLDELKSEFHLRHKKRGSWLPSKYELEANQLLRFHELDFLTSYINALLSDGETLIFILRLDSKCPHKNQVISYLHDNMFDYLYLDGKNNEYCFYLELKKDRCYQIVRWAIENFADSYRTLFCVVNEHKLDFARFYLYQILLNKEANGKTIHDLLYQCECFIQFCYDASCMKVQSKQKNSELIFRMSNEVAKRLGIVVQSNGI